MWWPGSGSSGAGSTGATGATGADGTIAVPSADSDLAITASTTADTDMTLGQVTRDFTVSGTDNLTADDRTRYYGYLGTSSTAKSAVVTITGFTDGSAGSWPMDTRLKATDNFTVSAVVNINLGAGDGSITHLIICPGNEAGDATSCASAAINDRGLGALVSDITDNVTRVFINYTTAFTLITADSIDNVTATQVITDTKSTTTSPTLGTASTVVTEATGFSAVMDSVIYGSTLYTLTAKDNGTLTACASGTCSTSASAVFVSTVKTVSCLIQMEPI